MQSNKNLKNIPRLLCLLLVLGSWIATTGGVMFFMKKIPLTRGKFALVDDADYEHLNQFKWCAHFRSRNYYAERGLYLGGGKANPKRKTIMMHNEIMQPPIGMFVDHRFHNTLDNRRANLRLATIRQNNTNRRSSRSKKSSHYLGVAFEKDRKKWTARIRVNTKGIRLGSFATEIGAAKAYDEAAKKFHGEFANLNFKS